MIPRLPLSAIVICRDEEGNIERCLKSLSFCDEIILVDSGSQDRTCELARPLVTQLVTREWRGYADQKNFGNGLAKHDWVLSVDADEWVGDELREEISLLFLSQPSEVAFSIPRRTIHLGRWIRHGGWYPNRLVRLFRRSQGHWIGDEVHERWDAKGAVGQIQSDLIHHSFEDLSDQVERNNRYSSLGAERLHRQGRRFSLPCLLLKPLSKFLETYLLKKGFLDGYPGFIISVSAAYSVFLKWAKLWELQRVREKN